MRPAEILRKTRTHFSKRILVRKLHFHFRYHERTYGKLERVLRNWNIPVIGVNALKWKLQGKQEAKAPGFGVKIQTFKPMQPTVTYLAFPQDHTYIYT